MTAERLDLPLFEALKLIADIPLADTPALVNNDHEHIAHHHGHHVTVVSLAPKIPSAKTDSSVFDPAQPSRNADTSPHHEEHGFVGLVPEFCIATERGLVQLHGESDLGCLGFAQDTPLPEDFEDASSDAQGGIKIIPIFECNQDDQTPTADDVYNTHAQMAISAV